LSTSRGPQCPIFAGCERLPAMPAMAADERCRAALIRSPPGRRPVTCGEAERGRTERGPIVSGGAVAGAPWRASAARPRSSGSGERRIARRPGPAALMRHAPARRADSRHRQNGREQRSASGSDRGHPASPPTGPPAPPTPPGCGRTGPCHHFCAGQRVAVADCRNHAGRLTAHATRRHGAVLQHGKHGLA
jgi:hypothetical protein